MFTNFIKLEPSHMKGSKEEKVISTDAILEVTKSSDGKEFYLNRTVGKNIPLTERGYNFIINALNPVMDNVEIIGDGLGENQL